MNRAVKLMPDELVVYDTTSGQLWAEEGNDINSKKKYYKMLKGGKTNYLLKYQMPMD